jgi:hypothetical protein
MDSPEVITKSARSLAASKRWQEKRKKELPSTKDIPMSTKTFDWHLFISAGSVIVTLGSIIFGCYFSLRSDIGDVRSEIVKIETVLILKGVAPPELFTAEEK